MIQTAKQNSNLNSLVESAGVELDRRGFGLCPFHTEKTPSFKVFPDNRFKCFGCGEYGDQIDFVRKLHGLSFPDALKHLGISQGRMTPQMKAEIARRKRKAELIKKFRKWCLKKLGHVGCMIFDIETLMENISPDDLDHYAPLLHALPVLEYQHYLLINGNDREIYKFYQEAQNGKRRFRSGG